MKTILILITVLGATLFVSPSSPQISPEEEALLEAVRIEMKAMYNAQPIDDAFSRKVFQDYIAVLDPQKRFLTREDIELLMPYEERIDDEFVAAELDFFEASILLLKNKISISKEYYNSILKNYGNKNITVEWETNSEKLDFAPDQNALKVRWQKIATYAVNQNLLVKERSQPKTDFQSLKQEAIADTKGSFDRLFSQKKSQTREILLTQYINTILTIHGPHNQYLPPQKMQVWNNEMARKMIGIGINIEKKGEYTHITKLVPNGPAAKSQGLINGDILLATTQKNEEEVNLRSFSVAEVVTQLKGEKNSTLKLTVRKQDGSINTVLVTRDELVLEDEFARSAVLENKQWADKIGYIKLNRFYFNPNEENGRSSGEDVRLEIEKLKKSNVSGIIMDLRNNRGGSSREVIECVGFFVGSGPIMQMQNKDQSVNVYSSSQSQTQFDGELIVLVNERSGSGSELFSGTLQDYGRAVIVGSKATSGKGTAQRFANLSHTEIGHKEVALGGYLKLTYRRFFRAGGKSTQLQGVQPDIVMPNSYSLVTTGERGRKYPLPWTKIDSQDCSQNININPNLAEIKAVAKARILTDPRFASILHQAQRRRDLQENTMVNLDYNLYKNTQDSLFSLNQNETSLSTNSQRIEAWSSREDMVFIESDSLRKQLHKDWIHSLENDAYIEHALLIMHDLI